MANIMSRLFSSGNLAIPGILNETINCAAKPKFTNTTCGAINSQGILDEVSIRPITGGLARRQWPNGNLQIAGTFDEVSLGSVYNLNYFIVGGGGGGSGTIGGGGGAGGIATGTIPGAIQGATTYAITVAAGGSGGCSSTAPYRGGIGGNSSISGGTPLISSLTPTNYIGYGGGTGGTYIKSPGVFTANAISGGSGGGGSGALATPNGPLGYPGAAAIQPSSASGGSGQAGGQGSGGGPCQATCTSAGGGGGAGQAGYPSGVVESVCNQFGPSNPSLNFPYTCRRTGGYGGNGLQFTQFAPYGVTPGYNSGFNVAPGSGWFAGGGGGSNAGGLYCSPVNPGTNPGHVARGGAGGGGKSALENQRTGVACAAGAGGR